MLSSISSSSTSVTSSSSQFPVFTDTEVELITLLSRGFTDSEIAQALNFSQGYIPTLFKRINKKYKVRNRCHLVSVFIKSSYFN